MKNEITIVSIEKKKTKYVVTTNDGEYDFDEDTIIRFYVFKDKVFSKDEFSNILESVNVNKAMNKAINYLSFKSRTINEMDKYLYEFENRSLVIDKLIELGYLNDESYSKSYLDYCIRNKKGPLFFENKLLEKGIDKELISKYKAMYTDDNQINSIKMITDSFVLKNNTKPVNKIKTSLINKLIRDGFEKEFIYNFISRYEFIDNSLDSLKRDYEKKLLQLKNRYDDEYEIKKRLTAYLINKGYDYSNIKNLF